MIRKAIWGAWSTYSKVAETNRSIRLEVPNCHLKLVTAVIIATITNTAGLERIKYKG